MVKILEVVRYTATHGISQTNFERIGLLTFYSQAIRQLWYVSATVLHIEVRELD